MKADPRFVGQPKHFWANVRSISQKLGYTVRGSGQILVPTLDQMNRALEKIGLSSDHVGNDQGPTALGSALHDYFEYRADVLYGFVQHQLMDVNVASATYERLRGLYRPERPPPMNKQKGNKKAPAFFTAIINMLIEAHAQGHPCNYDPQQLTTVTMRNMPLRTLARRVDGAFPSTVNPVAVWEIKEYYYTRTFGSRVADGVYESLLDGMELEELREEEGVDVRHVLMVDSHYTWWGKGKSYLCRIVDMLHMGYLDEALFGHEVVDVLPTLVAEWVEKLESR